MNNKLIPITLASWISISVITILPALAQSYDVASFNYQGQSGGQGNITNINKDPYHNLPVNRNPNTYIPNGPHGITSIIPNASLYPNVPAQYLQPSPLTNPFVNPRGGPVAPLVPRLSGVPVDKHSGLPPTTLDSFVKEAGGHAEAIYGDEGTTMWPPDNNFLRKNRINAGIVGINNKGLTTGHGSWLPDAWGGDGTKHQPNEWSMSGPRQPKVHKKATKL